MAQSCYVCGGYLYRGVRHRTCEPAYRRHRFNSCEVCGKLSRGIRHRRCAMPTAPEAFKAKGYPPVGVTACGYCGAASRGTYHKGCSPIGLSALAIFPDDPLVIQRRCRHCQEWYPVAGMTGETIDTTEMWKPAGLSHGKRPRYDSICRACRADKRRITEGARGTRTPADTRRLIVELHGSGLSLAETGLAVGLSARTVARHWAARAA